MSDTAGTDAQAGGSMVSPDPRGEAALLLVESLIHELIARSTLTIASAIDVVQTAIDAQLAISDDRGDDPDAEPGVTRYLSAISASLRLDETAETLPSRQP